MAEGSINYGLGGGRGKNQTWIMWGGGSGTTGCGELKIAAKISKVLEQKEKTQKKGQVGKRMGKKKKKDPKVVICEFAYAGMGRKKKPGGEKRANGEARRGKNPWAEG